MGDSWTLHAWKPVANKWQVKKTGKHKLVKLQTRIHFPTDHQKKICNSVHELFVLYLNRSVALVAQLNLGLDYRLAGGLYH